MRVNDFSLAEDCRKIRGELSTKKWEGSPEEDSCPGFRILIEAKTMGNRHKQPAVGNRRCEKKRRPLTPDDDLRLTAFRLLEPLFLQVLGEFPLFFIQGFGVAEENADIFIAFAPALQAG